MAEKPGGSREILIPTRWNDNERTDIRKKWVDYKKVAVIYYLSRNGQLEHPHFIQVPLSSSNGLLYLKDVIDRLNSLRGHGMGYLYSWSSKRSYKNGYVWQDLSEDDVIHPTNGHDCILKGSELLQTTINETASLGRSKYSSSSCNSNEARDASSLSITTSVPRRRRNQSWSSFENYDADDLRREYLVTYKCESSREFSEAVDAATQTEEYGNKSVELSTEELSPPVSVSSSDGSNGVSGSGDVDSIVNICDRTVKEECDSSGKIKALIQLIACGPLFGLKHYGPIRSRESKMKAQVNRPIDKSREETKAKFRAST